MVELNTFQNIYIFGYLRWEMPRTDDKQCWYSLQENAFNKKIVFMMNTKYKIIFEKH